MQFPAALQEAYQAVIQLPLWLKVLMPLIGLLVRHFWPQSGDFVDKIMSLFNRSSPMPDSEEHESQPILDLIDRLLSRRAVAEQQGDHECVERCTERLDSLLEMLK